MEEEDCVDSTEEVSLCSSSSAPDRMESEEQFMSSCEGGDDIFVFQTLMWFRECEASPSVVFRK